MEAPFVVVPPRVAASCLLIAFDLLIDTGLVHAVATLPLVPRVRRFDTVDEELVVGGRRLRIVRPRSADDLPLLGPLATCAGLIVATGHFRNGILLAPLTAELVARCVVEQTMADELRPFGINRFDERPIAGSIQSAISSPF
jgi:hypothetical protein